MTQTRPFPNIPDHARLIQLAERLIADREVMHEMRAWITTLQREVRRLEVENANLRDINEAWMNRVNGKGYPAPKKAGT